MNIAFVSNVIYPYVTGGAEKRIHEIGTRLADNGHDITIYGRHYWDGPEKITQEGMTLHAVSPSRELYTDDEGRRSIREALEFTKDLMIPLYRNTNDHDVIVASVFPYFPIFAAKFSTYLTDVPLVTTWHEVWKDYWNDYLGYLAPFGKTIELLTAQFPQYPIAVSGITANRLADIGPPRDKIEVVPNGIDIQQIQAASLPEQSYRPDNNPGFNILFAGRLIADKRVDRLLEAFDQVADSHDVTLGVIGDGPEATRLRKKAANLTHTSQVTFLGFLDQYEDVLGYMRAADIFASPSTREGFGITYAEAMAAGCTVIGAKHPESAASEVVQDGGFLVKPTVNNIADALDAALSGQRPPTAPETIVQQFTWDRVASKALETYRNAANIHN